MKKPFFALLAVVLFCAAALVRFTDLTDQPLDFNPSRQLYSAIIARLIYLENLPDADPQLLAQARAHRAELEILEPPIIETLTAAGYRLAGGEALWIPRVFSILVWLGGSVVVFSLGLQLGGGSAGALVGTAYYLFLPLSIYASRSFQIDPAMVVMTAAALFGLYRWQSTHSWAWAAVTGISAGLAVFFKGYGAILLGPPLAAGVWAGVRGTDSVGVGETLRRLLRDRQVWLMLALTLGPTLLYYPSLPGQTESIYTRSIFYRYRDVLSPSFYIRWLILLDRLLGLPVILAAIGSAWLAPAGRRGPLLGLWLGYLLYGLAFPKLIITHDYYQLPLALIVALSLAPAAGLVGTAILRQGRAAQAAFAGVLLLSAAYPAWIARSVLLAEDYRNAGAYWVEVGQAIPTDGRAVGYTQDYGFRLMYYGWRAISLLPEQITAEEFLDQYAGADYFVVTARNQMSDDLAEYLRDAYPVIAEGGGYAVYDLQP